MEEKVMTKGQQSQGQLQFWMTIYESIKKWCPQGLDRLRANKSFWMKT
jgi:hypothetical protein